LNKTGEENNFKSSPIKTEVMAFKGKDPVRSKIVINGNILKQVSHFNCLCCSLSYNDGDVQTKLTRSQAICSTIWRALGKQKRRTTQLTFYKIMAIPSLLHGRECWVL
jgi:hypothetical protein